MYPFERFTEPAKAVLSAAQKEAEQAGHSYIGTEHLLLGLMRVEQCVAARALASLGVELEPVRTTIAAVLGRNERILIQQIIPTSRVKKVIEIAFGEAQRGSRGHVGTAQLLLALLIEGDGIAAHVLRDMGADYEKVAAAVAAVEAEGVTETGSPSEPHEVTRVTETGSPSEPHEVTRVPLGTGARALVHDPEPPHRLWEGRVTGSSPQGLEVEVADRPAGEKMTVDPMLVHPIPMAMTLYCRYCIEPPAP